MTDPLPLAALPKPSQELEAYRSFSLAAVNDAIMQASRRLIDLPDNPERAALTEKLAGLFDLQADLQALHIAAIANSPAVQGALRELMGIVADLEGATARLAKAKNFVAHLAKLLGSGGKALKALKKIQDAAEGSGIV